MFSVKGIFSVGLFLFGTTFLWMTREFLSDRKGAEGFLWTAIGVLVLVAIVGFSAAAIGAFRDASWWEPVAVASALVGLAATIPYVVGVRELGQFHDAGVAINVALHAIGPVIVIAIVLVPVLHDWLAERL